MMTDAIEILTPFTLLFVEKCYQDTVLATWVKRLDSYAQFSLFGGPEQTEPLTI